MRIFHIWYTVNQSIMCRCLWPMWRRPINWVRRGQISTTKGQSSRCETLFALGKMLRACANALCDPGAIRRAKMLHECFAHSLARMKDAKPWHSVGDPWHFGADPDPRPAPPIAAYLPMCPDPYLWLMDTDPFPTPFFSDCKDAKNYFFSYLFLITYPQAHYFSLINWLFAKILC